MPQSRKSQPKSEEIEIGSIIDPEDYDYDNSEFLFWRLEPVEYTGGDPEYLGAIQGVWTEDDIQEKWGGGKYRMRVRIDKKFAPGGKTFSIAGPPKKPVYSGKGSSGSGTQDPDYSNEPMYSAMLREMSKMRSDLLEVAKGNGRPSSNSTSSERIQEFQAKIDAMIEAKWMIAVLEPQKTDVSSIGDLLLRAMETGADLSPAESDSGSGMVNRVLNLITGALQRGGDLSKVQQLQRRRSELGRMDNRAMNLEDLGSESRGMPETAESTDNLGGGDPSPAVNEPVEEDYDMSQESIQDRVSESVYLMVKAIKSPKDYPPEEILEISTAYLLPGDYQVLRGLVSYSNLRSMLSGDILLEFDSVPQGSIDPILQLFSNKCQESPDG